MFDKTKLKDLFKIHPRPWTHRLDDIGGMIIYDNNHQEIKDINIPDEFDMFVGEIMIESINKIEIPEDKPKDYFPCPQCLEEDNIQELEKTMNLVIKDKTIKIEEMYALCNQCNHIWWRPKHYSINRERVHKAIDATKF